MSHAAPDMSTQKEASSALAVDAGWVSGKCTLYNADCMDVIPTLTEVDAVITSPPYNLGAMPWKPLGHWKPGAASGSGGRNKWAKGAESGAGVQYGEHTDAMPWPEYEEWQRAVLRALWGKLSAGGAIFYNHKPRVVGTSVWLPLALKPDEIPLRQIIIWARPGGMNYGPAAFVPTHEWVMLMAKPDFRLRSKGVSGLGDVWRIAPEKNEHPAPFPLALPSNVLEATTAETILDPFMGSGTTGVAAVRAGRTFIGIEKDPRHFAQAVERIKQAQDDLFASPNVEVSRDRA